MKWMLAKEKLNLKKSTLLVQVVINRRYVGIIHMIVEFIFLLSVNMSFPRWHHSTPFIFKFIIITLMIIENRALWLARSFALSRYDHRAVIITLKASSFQNGSKIFWFFGVGNLSMILFSGIIINVTILKQLVAWGDWLLNSYPREV